MLRKVVLDHPGQFSCRLGLPDLGRIGILWMHLNLADSFEGAFGWLGGISDFDLGFPSNCWARLKISFSYSDTIKYP